MGVKKGQMGNTTSGKRHNSGDDSGPTITANRLGDSSLEEGDFDPTVFKVRDQKKHQKEIKTLFIYFKGVKLSILHVFVFVILGINTRILAFSFLLFIL